MRPYRYARALLALIAVLFVFLIVEAFLVSYQERKALTDAFHSRVKAQMDLIADASYEALLKEDYVTIRTFIRRWGETHEDFLKIQAVAPNGFVIGEYQRNPVDGSRTFSLSRTVSLDGRQLLKLEVVSTFRDIEETARGIRNRLLMGAVVFTLLLGMALWRSLRTMAIVPLEREIAAREQAEEELRGAHGALEQKVRERTAALQQQLEERLRIEQALKEREEHINLLLSSTAEGIYGIDTNGICTFCNPSAFRMLGYTQDTDVLGRNMHDLVHHTRANGTDYPEQDCTIYRAYRKREGSHSDQEFFWREDGTSFPVEFWSYPVLREGTVIGAVVAFVDITERKRLEAQLLQSQKMEAVGTLAGGVAHDFNNILTAVLGYASLLQMKMGDGDPLKPNVLQIIDSAKRAATLTQSLLAFSRRQVMKPRHVDLNDIVQRVEKLLHRLIGEDIELDTALAQDELMVLADAVQIEQVLMNLATNARDAMPAGGRLTIRSALVMLDREDSIASGLLRPGAYALLTVADSGSGMDTPTREKIFEPFFTTKEVGQGTGLGLAIVYGIVKQHNGSINVSSEPGVGTIFKIYLPITLAAAEELHVRTGDDMLPQGTETILVAEDDLTLRQFTRTLLEEFGYTVIEALNGDDAVRAFREHAEDIKLVLLDTIMPRKNGKEAYEEIKAIAPDVKAIFMSGYTAEIIDKRGLLDTGIEFIQKPMPPTELLTKIREVLDQPS